MGCHEKTGVLLLSPPPRAGEWGEEAKAVVFRGRYCRRSALLMPGSSSMDLHDAPISPGCRSWNSGEISGGAGCGNTEDCGGDCSVLQLL